MPETKKEKITPKKAYTRDTRRLHMGRYYTEGGNVYKNSTIEDDYSDIGDFTEKQDRYQKAQKKLKNMTGSFTPKVFSTEIAIPRYTEPVLKNKIELDFETDNAEIEKLVKEAEFLENFSKRVLEVISRISLPSLLAIINPIIDNYDDEREAVRELMFYYTSHNHTFPISKVFNSYFRGHTAENELLYLLRSADSEKFAKIYFEHKRRESFIRRNLFGERD